MGSDDESCFNPGENIIVWISRLLFFLFILMHDRLA